MVIGERTRYAPDAWRTPWRVAAHDVRNAAARVVSYLHNVAVYVESNAGIVRRQTPNNNYRGVLAMSASRKDATTAQEDEHVWLTTSVDDESYFPSTLRPVYMLLAANQFPKSCAP